MSTQINDHSIPTRDKWKEGERERKKKAGKKPYTQQFNPCQSTLLHVMSKLSNVFKSICNRMMVEKKNWCDYYTKITSLINRPQILQGHSFITCMEKQFKWLAFHDNGLTCCNCFFTFFFFLLLCSFLVFRCTRKWIWEKKNNLNPGEKKVTLRLILINSFNFLKLIFAHLKCFDWFKM